MFPPFLDFSYICYNFLMRSAESARDQLPAGSVGSRDCIGHAKAQKMEKPSVFLEIILLLQFVMRLNKKMDDLQKPAGLLRGTTGENSG